MSFGIIGAIGTAIGSGIVGGAGLIGSGIAGGLGALGSATGIGALGTIGSGLGTSIAGLGGALASPFLGGGLAGVGAGLGTFGGGLGIAAGAIPGIGGVLAPALGGLGGLAAGALSGSPGMMGTALGGIGPAIAGNYGGGLASIASGGFGSTPDLTGIPAPASSAAGSYVPGAPGAGPYATPGGVQASVPGSSAGAPGSYVPGAPGSGPYASPAGAPDYYGAATGNPMTVDPYVAATEQSADQAAFRKQLGDMLKGIADVERQQEQSNYQASLANQPVYRSAWGAPTETFGTRNLMGLAQLAGGGGGRVTY